MSPTPPVFSHFWPLLSPLSLFLLSILQCWALTMTLWFCVCVCAWFFGSVLWLCSLVVMMCSPMVVHPCFLLRPVWFLRFCDLLCARARATSSTQGNILQHMRHGSYCIRILHNIARIIYKKRARENRPRIKSCQTRRYFLKIRGAHRALHTGNCAQGGRE